jgi:hypothetical protein
MKSVQNVNEDIGIEARRLLTVETENAKKTAVATVSEDDRKNATMTARLVHQVNVIPSQSESVRQRPDR